MTPATAVARQTEEITAEDLRILDQLGPIGLDRFSQEVEALRAEAKFNEFDRSLEERMARVPSADTVIK